MASPATRTVTGLIQAPPGTGDSGIIAFKRVDTLIGPTADAVLPPYVHTTSFGTSGAFSIDLPVNDDSAWSPTGWPYTVTIRTDSGWRPEPFDIEVPDGASDLDLSDLIQAGTPSTPSAYVMKSAVGTVNGPAGPLDADGLIPADQIPAAGSAQPLDATLTALAALDATAGLLVQTGADAFARRTLTAGSAAVTVSNGSGAGGNPTIDVDESQLSGIPQSAVTGLTAALAATQDALAVGDSGYVTSGNVTATGGSWTQVAADVTVTAGAGDTLLITADALCAATGGDLQFDAVTVVSGSVTTWVSSADGSGRWPGGIAAWYVPSGFTGPRASAQYTVQAGDVSGGQVTVRLLVRSSGSDRAVNQNSSYPSRLSVVVIP